MWEVGGKNPSHTPKLPHLNYATGFGIKPFGSATYHRKAEVGGAARLYVVEERFSKAADGLSPIVEEIRQGLHVEVAVLG